LDLDPADRTILMMLQNDARTPVAQIARRLQLGETTVRYRINRLLREGVISRFSALLNPRRIGYPVDAILLVKTRPRHLQHVFDRMAQMEETSHILQTTGEYDMITVVHARSMHHLNEIRHQVKSIRGVGEVGSWIATGLVKVDPVYRLE
jgi:Lrp/AsnC family transcriptional regulator for asnA, asnC and gidA